MKQTNVTVVPIAKIFEPIVRFSTLFVICFCVLSLPAQSEAKTVVAVLPLENLMKDTQLDWLSKGIATTVSSKLSNVPELTVVVCKSTKPSKNWDSHKRLLWTRAKVWNWAR